jgi:RNA-splicing ligase RtcB
VLHSGSRGVGNQLAQRHIKVAQKLEHNSGLEDRDLAYFIQSTPEFDEYISDMLWAQSYAMENRRIMMDRAIEQVARATGFWPFPHVGPFVVEQINCHHNFTERETFGADTLWITRKGAIKADRGDRGVIPGSMGTKSYIISGLGNADSWNSCSHGAGRRMGRKEAKRQFTEDDLAREMSGVKSWNSRNAKGLIDEIPSSYKDIDQVMADQADLVTVDHTLHQVLNYKGV